MWAELIMNCNLYQELENHLKITLGIDKQNNLSWGNQFKVERGFPCNLQAVIRRHCLLTSSLQSLCSLVYYDPSVLGGDT